MKNDDNNKKIKCNNNKNKEMNKGDMEAGVEIKWYVEKGNKRNNNKINNNYNHNNNNIIISSLVGCLLFYQ